jgi:Flp pilus assembly protein TadD
MDSRNALLKGLKQQQQGKYVDAERAYLRVLEQEPRNPDALHLLGTVYLRLGRPDKAASCIRQSITINPRFATAHANLGAALRACGDPGAAAESCERARAQSARSSPLFDMNRLCRNFEATLRQMWDFHRAGEQPRTFLVGPTNETVT